VQGGGASSCSTLNASGSCVSGYGKPKWQTGTGLPDVVLFASGGWPDIHYYVPIPPSEIPPLSFILGAQVITCYSGSEATYGAHPCKYDDVYKDVIFQGNGGSAISTAYWAGIMALVEQKEGGGRQGLVNPTLYKLWGKESLSACNTLTVSAGNKCTFYDIAAALSNAEPCAGMTGTGSSHPDCDYTQPSTTSQQKYGLLTGYMANVGYDQTTGLGSVNITNLVDNWSSVAPSPTVDLSATKLAFGSVAKGSTSPPQTLTIKNTGSVVVTFTSGGITLTDPDSAAFTKTTTCGSTLVIGGSCTITVEFKPTAAVGASAKLSIADNATGSPQTVSLTGTGT
jgi:trimeric autotransporter adhesin